MAQPRSGVALQLVPTGATDALITQWFEGLSSVAKEHISENDRALLRAMFDAEIVDQRLKFSALLCGMPLEDDDISTLRDLAAEYVNNFSAGALHIDSNRQERLRLLMEKWGWS